MALTTVYALTCYTVISLTGNIAANVFVECATTFTFFYYVRILFLKLEDIYF